ncbi:MAG: hypothetical protein ABR957_02995 [Terracidiphilus sp.]|jgi:fumarate reductase subunit C
MKIAPDWLFQGNEGAARTEILRWWERRRIFFNLYVGLIGIVTWSLVLIAGSAAVKSGVDFEEPFAMILGPFVYGVLANICYSFGAVVDLVFYRGRPRATLFKVGLIFSLALTALPGLWAVTAWLMTVFTGKKLD